MDQETKEIIESAIQARVTKPGYTDAMVASEVKVRGLKLHPVTVAFIRREMGIKLPKGPRPGASSKTRRSIDKKKRERTKTSRTSKPAACKSSFSDVVNAYEYYCSAKKKFSEAIVQFADSIKNS